MARIDYKLPLQTVQELLGTGTPEADAEVAREALCESVFFGTDVEDLPKAWVENRLRPLLGPEIAAAADGHVSALEAEDQTASPSDAFDAWDVGDLPIPASATETFRVTVCLSQGSAGTNLSTTGRWLPKTSAADQELIRTALACRIRQALSKSEGGAS